MDFGLAKMVEEVRRATTVIGGTPYYMAPEQSAGDSVDHRADLYALGVTFYELLTGSVPFREGDVRHSLADIGRAQELLGWDQDVSLYVVTDDGRLTPGEQLLDGVSVARRGELWSTFPRQWDGLMALIGTVTQAIGLAAAFSLAAMLWRLAWRRRWQMAVLRSLGFSRTVFAIYLAVQGGAVAFAGGICGILVALALLRWVRPTLAGVSLRPQLTSDLLLSTTVWLGSLTLLSVVLPVWALGRRRVAELMIGE